MPAAQKQQRGNGTYSDHVGVFSHKESGEFHGGIFDVETSYQFVFRFRQIERNTIGFSKGCNHEQEEAENLSTGEDVPVRDAVPVACLGIHNLAKVQAVR